MIFRQLFDQKSSTFTYLLADEESGNAVLIDSVFEQHLRDAALIEELELKLLYVLETHVHADHVTGAWLMKERFKSQIAVSKHGGTTGADLLLDDLDVVSFGSRSLSVRATPGHTNSCVSYVLDGKSMVFTGDALLIRGAGRTDFQEGDASTLYHSVHEKILALPDTTIVYPGHDYVGRTSTSVAEEKQHNPRLGGQRSVEDFVGFMDNLGLAHPKQLAIALPGNLVCGKPNADRPGPQAPTWAPVFRNFAGIPEVDAQWLHENANAIAMVDVREPEEFEGELGHVASSSLIPLGSLRDSLDALERKKPVVLICRSGGRSGQATLILEKEGFKKVANLRGGMIRWREEGLPVEGAIDLG
jgi:sulfur dioxygenase